MFFYRMGVRNTALLSCSLLCSMLISGCGLSQRAHGVNAAYVAEIQQWQKKRIASLTGPNGWLSVAGLFWLEEGENSFGADTSNDIVFPGRKAPGFIGTFVLEDGVVSAHVKPGVDVLHKGEPVKSIELQSDADGDPTVLTLGSLSWFIIKRGEKFAVRLRDSKSPHLSGFKGIETFPIDPAWHIRATFETYDPPKIVPLPTVLGTITKQPSPGALVFRIHGRTYRLDAIAEPDDESLFVIFADETNGVETYDAGRFLYVDRPGEDGATFIDFNKAYNPPCAFTTFATCPLPPQQNRLPVRITAGEKKYGDTIH